MIRTLAIISISLISLILPWYIIIPSWLIYLSLFDNPVEIIALGLILETNYHAVGTKYEHFYLYILSALIMYFTVAYLKPRFR